jgi:hypothetical protein
MAFLIFWQAALRALLPAQAVMALKVAAFGPPDSLLLEVVVGVAEPW